MKTGLYILLFMLWGLTAADAGEPDTLTYSRKEYLKIEPIRYDQATYDDFKKDAFYDYYRIKAPEESLFDRLFRWFREKINSNVSRREFDTGMWIVGIVFVLAVGVILYRTHPSIFYFNRKNKLLYSIEEDDINVENFSQRIQEALTRGNYSEAIRRLYLQTLKTLHDRELISWDVHKTVNEYVYEIKDLELRKNFRLLSEEFVYYRYGNGEANEMLFRKFESVNEQIIKRLR